MTDFDDLARHLFRMWNPIDKIPAVKAALNYEQKFNSMAGLSSARAIEKFTHQVNVPYGGATQNIISYLSRFNMEDRQRKMEAKFPFTPFHKLINQAGIWDRYAGSLNDLAQPLKASNFALTGLTKTLISRTHDFIETTQLDEEDQRESKHTLAALKETVESNVILPPDETDLLTLKSIVEDTVNSLHEELKELEGRMTGKIDEVQKTVATKIDETKADPRIINIGIGADILTIIQFILMLIAAMNTDDATKQIAQATKDLPDQRELVYEVLDTLGIALATSNVKLRNKPDSTDKHNEIYTLPKGTLVQVQDDSTPYWFKVWCDNPENPELKIEGYVYKRYFTPISKRIQDLTED